MAQNFQGFQFAIPYAFYSNPVILLLVQGWQKLCQLVSCHSLPGRFPVQFLQGPDEAALTTSIPDLHCFSNIIWRLHVALQ
uniref:Uncharacterized protein n=1 Tax=Salix viminalis TaxID=40686 RepID=A0A6N2KG59_SALVM